MADEEAQAGGLLAQIITGSGLYHMIACGGSREDQIAVCGTSAAAADNTELHAVACCSDDSLGDFTKPSTALTNEYNCPYTSRLDSPLVCYSNGTLQNSENCMHSVALIDLYLYINTKADVKQ